jgi:hypothetical protein
MKAFPFQEKGSAPNALKSETKQETPVKPVGERPDDQNPAYKEINAIFERQGVLTQKKSFTLEYSTQYSYSSSTRVAILGYTIIPAITIGLIDIRSASRQAAIGSLAARYGLTKRMELELRVPYVYRHETSSTQSLATPSPDSAFNTKGNALGDVEFGFRYQLNMPKGNQRIFIAGLRAKTRTGRSPFEARLDPATNLPTRLPTGSGFWAFQPSLTAIFPSDPAVFFGSMTYYYNPARTLKEYGRINPGDMIGGNFGMGLAINEKASFSLGYEHSVVLQTKQNGKRLANSRAAHIASLLIGISHKLSPKRNFNISISAGLTEDAPDVQLSFKLPISFAKTTKPR